MDCEACEPEDGMVMTWDRDGLDRDLIPCPVCAGEVTHLEFDPDGIAVRPPIEKDYSNDY